MSAVASKPAVSICIPTFRRAHLLSETLCSALTQTFEDFELVVVDDCSPDNTAEVVRNFCDPRIRYVRNHRNLGVPENLNRAFSLATGDCLLILEDHDLLAPNYLAESLRVMDVHPSVGFVATGLIRSTEQQVETERFVADLPEFTPGRRLLRKLLVEFECPFTVTTMVRRPALAHLRPWFDSRYWWYADIFLWLRLSALCDFGYVAAPLLTVRPREAAHPLARRHRESWLCLDRMRRDNWTLLHKRRTVRSAWDWAMYEAVKLRAMAVFRMARRVDGDWSAQDEQFLRSYLPAASRAMLKAVDLVPRTVLGPLRRRYRARAQQPETSRSCFAGGSQ